MKEYEIDTVLLKHGVSKELMNSLALFVYQGNYAKEESPTELFNKWAEFCEMRIKDIETVLWILDHIRKLLNTERKDLEKALMIDFFLEEKG